jgi:hypothetical protein
LLSLVINNFLSIDEIPIVIGVKAETINKKIITIAIMLFFIILPSKYYWTLDLGYINISYKFKIIVLISLHLVKLLADSVKKIINNIKLKLFRICRIREVKKYEK